MEAVQPRVEQACVDDERSPVVEQAKRLIVTVTGLAEKLRDLPPLFFRLILAYGFIGPGLEKAKHFSATAEWFGSLGIPFPTLNLAMAISTEIGGSVLLLLGLATRFISVPMSFVMVVAIATVHWRNGFAAGDNGFEIPFYYMLMLFSLIATGGGRLSLDHLISRKLGLPGSGADK